MTNIIDIIKLNIQCHIFEHCLEEQKKIIQNEPIAVEKYNKDYVNKLITSEFGINNDSLKKIEIQKETFEQSLDDEIEKFLEENCPIPTNELFLFSVITCNFSLAKFYWKKVKVSFILI